MAHFTEAEIAYLSGQRLGRLATVSADGAPHVVPTSFRYNPTLDTLDLGGIGMGRSKKFRDARDQRHVAFVVDDIAQPRQPRFIEVRGEAEALGEGGEALGPGFDPAMIRIHPTRIIAWGIEGEPSKADPRNFRPNARSVG
ncbi:MAG TPA: PPOX class F420-dependent oxidoreductase [Ktedonobacterales bacterium]